MSTPKNLTEGSVKNPNSIKEKMKVISSQDYLIALEEHSKRLSQKETKKNSSEELIHLEASFKTHKIKTMTAWPGASETKWVSEGEYFQLSNFDDFSKELYWRLSDEYKSKILQYFSEARQDWIIEPKDLDKLWTYLLLYYDNMEWKKRYMADDNATLNELESSLGWLWKKIEKIFKRYSTRFSDDWKKIDKLFSEYIDNRIQKKEEWIQKNREEIQKNKEMIQEYKERQKLLEELLK